MAPATARHDVLPNPPGAFLRTGYRELPIDDLVPSSHNPRRHVSDVADLAASVREVGILEPILVRPVGEALATGEAFEIIAGERRYRAAREAGLSTVPVIVRELTDAQALELAIVENNQRADVHPLDEAEAFAHLQSLDRAYEPEVIAAKIGRPLAYVKGRLKLLALVDDVREAFSADRITIGHAQLLAKVPADLQPKALEDGCFDERFSYEDDGYVNDLTTVSDLRHWINTNVALGAQDLESPEVQEEFPEMASDVAQAKAAGATVLMLSESYVGREGQGGALPRESWREATEQTIGAQLGVIVAGRRRGRTVWVTLVKAKTPEKPTKATPGKKKTAAEIEADREARAAEVKRREAEKAREARESEVQKRAAVQLVTSIDSASLETTEPLCVLAQALLGGDHSQDVIDAACGALGVSPKALTFHGSKALDKLPPAKLRPLVALLAVGYVNGSQMTPEKAYAAFGVDLKAIDKAVAKEQAAAAKAGPDAPKTKKAAKKAKKR